MAQKPKKGVAGASTGTKTRRAINAAIKRGCSQEQIARSARRDSSVISDIKLGKIKNPPSNVATSIQKACAKAKPKK